MAADREERNRVLGFPVDRPGQPGRRREPGEEQQRVLGLPVSAFEDANLDWLNWLVHPVREYRQWARRRQDPGTPDQRR